MREAGEAWGLQFRHHHGGSGERYMVETVAGGVVLFDYDGDGDVDVFFVDGGELPGYEGEEPRSRLFRNDLARFVDVTDAAGVEVAAYGMGGCAGDYDGDGDLDLYVTAFGPNQLFENGGDGGFRDVTSRAGVGDPLWSASAAFADPDLDGDLDLYVTNYVDFSLANHKFCGDRERGIRGYCHPDRYDPLPDRYYSNRGDGTFLDATSAAGLRAAVGPGLGVLFEDLDADGLADVYVANDAEPNFLFRNRGDGTFEDLSLLSGTAYGDKGQPEGGMGVDAGDVDGDGTVDIVVTNFEFESNALYLGGFGERRGLYVDGRFRADLAEPSLAMLAFGVVLGDLDLDGDLDLVVANGHILDNAEVFNERSRYAQPNQVFENLGGGRFREVDAGLDAVRVSRGMASGDLDRDGDLDLVIVNSNDEAEVYENVTTGGSWLQIDLRSHRGERFGVGSRLELESGGEKQLRQVRTATSYLSQNPLTVHLGLGEVTRVERLSVRWPGGERVRHLDLPANRRLLLSRWRTDE